MFLQRTLRKSVSIEGIGLHSGRLVKVELRPAPVGVGICVMRTDLPGQPYIPVQAKYVKATQLATTLGPEEFQIATVEHCLAAIAALRIDNVYIAVSGNEMPIVDGSALPFAQAMMSVGFSESSAPRQYIYMNKPVHVGSMDKFAYIQPYNGLRITCTIDFSHPKIGIQKLDLDISERTFLREIAPARTFGFVEELQALQAKGLGLGGSLDNAIGLTSDSILNPEGLRFEDEFVRHKCLDAIGDLAILGAPVLGHVVLYRAGHDLMNKLVKQILQEPTSYRRLDLGQDLPGTSEILTGLRQSV